MSKNKNKLILLPDQKTALGVIAWLFPGCWQIRISAYRENHHRCLSWLQAFCHIAANGTGSADVFFIPRLLKKKQKHMSQQEFNL